MPFREIAVCGSLVIRGSTSLNPGLFALLTVAEFTAILVMRSSIHPCHAQEDGIELSQMELTRLSSSLGISKLAAITAFAKYANLCDLEKPSDNTYAMIRSKILENFNDKQADTLHDFYESKTSNLLTLSCVPS